MSIWNKIKDAMLGDEPQEEMSPLMSRKELEDKILEHFTTRMKHEQTKVSFLYPTCFKIYLNNEDHDAQCEAFEVTATDMVALFNEEIRKMLKKYPDHKPLARSWEFQFESIVPGNIIEGRDNIELQPHEVFILSKLYPTPQATAQPAEGQGRMVMTMHPKDSRLSKVHFNPNAVGGMDVRSPGHFTIPLIDFDHVGGPKRPDDIVTPTVVAAGDDRKTEVEFTSSTPSTENLPREPQRPRQPQPLQHGFATLRIDHTEGCFLVDGAASRALTMEQQVLQVCGRNASNFLGGVQVGILDNEAIFNPHIIIRRSNINGNFSIEAKGDTRLNEMALTLHRPTPLPNNSVILLGGRVQLKFIINK